MKIHRLKVRNHRRTADFDIDVRDHLVLVGANDTGKSSIIRCLNLALGASTAQLYAQITPEDFRDVTAELQVEVSLQNFSEEEKSAFVDEINVDPITGEQEMVVRLGATVDADDTLSIERIALGAGTRRQLSRSQLAAIGWRFLGATSQAREMRGDRRSVLQDVFALVDLGAEQATFDAAVQQLATVLAESKVMGEVRAGLAAQLTGALPKPLKVDELAFVSGSAADRDVLNDVRLHLLRDGESRDVAAQSDGMRALYAIALYDMTSVGANVVAVDEPETHLHPTSQRSLARLLRSSANQKVVATHSPDIVSAFDSDSIVVIKDGGGVTQPKQGFLTSDERLTVRWWVRDRLEPLTAKRVIAVEGLADRVIVERVADLTGRSLDRLGVSLIVTNGSGDMGAINTLLGPAGFRVPLSLLIDADAEVETAAKMGVAVADLQAHGVWVSRADLEDEYVAAVGAKNLHSAMTTSSLIKPKQLAKVVATGPGGSFSEGDIAKFCRSFKVEAALVASALLDAAMARRVVSVHGLLDQMEAAL